MQIRWVGTVIVAVVALSQSGLAQRFSTVPGRWVGAPSEEYVRLLQLTGVMPLSSLMIRPTKYPENWTPPDTALWRAPWTRRYGNRGDVAKVGPVRVTTHAPTTHVTYNSTFAYGTNDGVMWAGRGFSASQTVGASALYGPITLDVAPTYTWSENRPFALDTLKIYPPFAHPMADAYTGLGFDRPQRFGDSALSVTDLGQSALSIEAYGARIGVSARNMWWGPGVEDAIAITNNAPGFGHLFAATRQPVSIGIGKIESMWIVGKLRQSKYWRVAGDTFPTDRWVNGLTVVFEPKFAPGMYFGATRLFMAYEAWNPIRFDELAKLFQTFQKNTLAVATGTDGTDRRDQMFSLSFRWVFPASGFEAYGEYARNDHNTDWRDFVMQMNHGRGMLLGAAKVFHAGDGVVQARAEATILSNTLTVLSRVAPVWYAHDQVMQGFTERGQVIGAATGPGSDHQSLSVDWFRPQSRLGVTLQRQLTNIDGYYRSGMVTPYEQSAWIMVTPRATFQVGVAEFTASYGVQYEFNRHNVKFNDKRNHRVELGAQLWLP